MEFEVLKSFAGPFVSGKKGKIISIDDKDLVKDYLNAGFIRPVKQEKSNAKAKGKETR